MFVTADSWLRNRLMLDSCFHEKDDDQSTNTEDECGQTKHDGKKEFPEQWRWKWSSERVLPWLWRFLCYIAGSYLYTWWKCGVIVLTNAVECYRWRIGCWENELRQAAIGCMSRVVLCKKGLRIWWWNWRSTTCWNYFYQPSSNRKHLVRKRIWTIWRADSKYCSSNAG